MKINNQLFKKFIMLVLHQNNVVGVLISISCLLLISTNGHAEEKLISVGTQPLSTLLISAKSSAPASIISLNHTVISAEITGQIKNINVEAGDQIKKGQALSSLDCRSYVLAKKQASAALKVAKAQLNYSRKQFKRNKLLVKQGTIPREHFEKSEANQLTAIADISLKKAAIETTELAISRCQISAPFAGQITKRLAQKGQFVTIGTPLFELMQSNNFEVKAHLSPMDIKKIKDSLELKFVSGDTLLKTAVRSIIQKVDEATRTQEIRLSYSKSAVVPAGLSGRLEWISKAQQLPAEYILRRNGQLGVFIATDKPINNTEGIATASFHPFPNAREGQAEEINLPDNTAIITKNRFRLHDAQHIKIQN